MLYIHTLKVSNVNIQIIIIMLIFYNLCNNELINALIHIMYVWIYIKSHNYFYILHNYIIYS